MNIETYATIVFRLYAGMFLLSVFIGAVGIWKRIRKKPLKFWWGISPCAILYSFFATISTFVAYLAYDDLSHPQYDEFKNWGLYDFILHDVKTLIIWLAIGFLLYFLSENNVIKGNVKKKIIWAVIGVVVVLLLVMFVASWEPACCIFGLF